MGSIRVECLTYRLDPGEQNGEQRTRPYRRLFVLLARTFPHNDELCSLCSLLLGETGVLAGENFCLFCSLFGARQHLGEQNGQKAP
jgi:hypothetical protein